MNQDLEYIERYLSLLVGFEENQYSHSEGRTFEVSKELYITLTGVKGMWAKFTDTGDQYFVTFPEDWRWPTPEIPNTPKSAAEISFDGLCDKHSNEELDELITLLQKKRRREHIDMAVTYAANILRVFSVGGQIDKREDYWGDADGEIILDGGILTITQTHDEPTYNILYNPKDDTIIYLVYDQEEENEPPHCIKNVTLHGEHIYYEDLLHVCRFLELRYTFLCAKELEKLFTRANVNTDAYVTRGWFDGEFFRFNVSEASLEFYKAKFEPLGVTFEGNVMKVREFFSDELLKY